LALLDLQTELGISTLQYMRNTIYKESETGKLMLLNFKYSQIEAGISEPLLEHPSIHIPYLTPTWITSVRQFLFNHNLQASLTDTLQIQLRGENDRCIMQLELLKPYTPQQQTDINLVRIYLQTITLSNLSAPDGKDICGYHLRGEQRRPQQRLRYKTWPRQETPSLRKSKTPLEEIHYLTTSSPMDEREGTTWNHRVPPNPSHTVSPTCPWIRHFSRRVHIETPTLVPPTSFPIRTTG
jgi:hypothetical protein